MTKNKMWKIVSVRLTEEQVEAMREKAAKNSRSASAEIRKAVDEYIIAYNSKEGKK
jgi:hypothetical protein